MEEVTLYYHTYHFPSIPLTNLTDTNCTDGVPWIRDYIGSCVLDGRHYAAVIFGLMSTLLSTVNGLPQIYLNCAKGIPDKALSILLILQWLAGDSLNLIGGILTHQTPVQLIYASFMVSVDIIMLVQYTFFKIKHSIEDSHAAKLRDTANIQDTSGSVDGTLPSRSYNGSVMFSVLATFWCTGLLSMDALAPRATWSRATWSQGRLGDEYGYRGTGRRLLMAQRFFHGTKDTIGFALGVISTLCYMGSRLPQIYKNWQRQSTQGVSFGLFFLMILSNLCYGTSILCHSTDLYPVLHSLPWIMGALGMILFDCISWIMGALGMILFDCIIMFQFWLYKHNIEPLDIESSADSEPLIDD